MVKAKLTWQERQSHSPFIESVWTTTTPTSVSRTAIADPCVEITLVKENDQARVILTGPRTKPSHTLLPSGYACITIRLKPGVCLKNFPAHKHLNGSLTLPADSKARFWFEGVPLQFPDFDHVEELIVRLHDAGYLDYEMPNGGKLLARKRPLSRTYSRLIKRITGLSPYKLYQLQRMHQALRLLKKGMPAADVASALAFVDQSHLIHASKQFFGHTPKRLVDLPQTS